MGGRQRVVGGGARRVGPRRRGHRRDPDRYDEFRSELHHPEGAARRRSFKAAIDACRSRTLQHITLPPGESFTVEYVTGKSWSGYNWYQGNYRSLIQVNTDLPIYVDRAIDLACHEGYPGHHVYNVLLEKNLRSRSRLDRVLGVSAVLAAVADCRRARRTTASRSRFPRAERLEFERRVLFPAAELEPDTAASYYDVLDLVDQLSYAGNEAARRYLNGEIDAKGAADWLEKYACIRGRAPSSVSASSTSTGAM